MDAVVLAGGRGQRLQGIVPAYHKPFIPINGTPLLVSAVEEACSAVDGNVFVILAPQNVQQAAELLNHANLLESNVYLVVQVDAAGPGDALLHALRLSTADHMLVLCGDNIFGKNDVRNVAAEDDRDDVVVGTRTTYDMEQAKTLTRIKDNRFFEGPLNESRMDNEWVCWLGPLRVRREVICSALESHKTDGELKIAPALNSVAPVCVSLVACNSFDIGTPEALNGK